MKTIYEALKTIMDLKIAVAPFYNYDPTYEITYKETDEYFKSNDNKWPIHSVQFSGKGNLNISFIIPGVMTETDGKTHECKEIRTITIVKDGELKLQFLQLTRDKNVQASIPSDIVVKNNIINLGQFVLTEADTVSIAEIFKEAVIEFANKLKKNSEVKPSVMTEEEYRLSLLGLRPDGFYCKPVKSITKDPVIGPKVSINGCSNKSTKTAKKLFDIVKTQQLPKSNLNELLYNARVLGVRGTVTSSCQFQGMDFSGTVTC